jgi:hypothetical protein
MLRTRRKTEHYEYKALRVSPTTVEGQEKGTLELDK